MLFKKHFKHLGEWRSVALDDKGLEALHDKLRQDNLRVWSQCMRDASNLCRDEARATHIAIVLFSKLADAKFTRINATLDEMVEEQRQSMDGGEIPPSSFLHNQRGGG